MTQQELPLEQIVNDVISAASLHSGTECRDDFRSALNAVGEHASREQARLLVANRMGEITSATGVGFLAVWLGAGVEGGADPDLTGQAILGSLLHWAGSIETLPDEDDDEPEVDSEIAAGLEMLGQGLVAHVSRSEKLRQNMAEDSAVVVELERVEYASAGAMWVLELLRKRSGTLVVIHVAERRGFHATYRNLSNCFHLFTLLQAALSDTKMPGANRVPSQLLSVAKGEAMEDCHDQAWWHYGIGTCPTADFGGSIWGEANPDSIPEVDGKQVVLLWPMIINSRQWGAGFFGPFLQASPPDVTVSSELTPSEVNQWSNRLELPQIVPKPWWKFW